MFYAQFRGSRGGRHGFPGLCEERHQQQYEEGREHRGRHCSRHGEFGEGRGRGFRGRWGGGMRMFGAGDLRYVILQLISEKPSHGYEIIKSIQERLGGTYAPSPGIVYPMLTMLEEMGYVSAVTEGTRKQYSITAEGAKALEENKAVVDALFQRMDSVRAEYQTQRPQQIERAVENLRMALRMKMGSLTTEQIHAITDIIDDAAKKIERA